MELILVGRIARAHGNKGQVIVNSETDFPADRFAAGNVLVVEQAGRLTERRILAVRFQQGRPIVTAPGKSAVVAMRPVSTWKGRLKADEPRNASGWKVRAYTRVVTGDWNDQPQTTGYVETTTDDQG